MKAATVERLHDPLLGWRWTVVCSWHGVTGRYRTKAEALIQAKNYHVDCEATA